MEVTVEDGKVSLREQVQPVSLLPDSHHDGGTRDGRGRSYFQLAKSSEKCSKKSGENEDDGIAVRKALDGNGNQDELRHLRRSFNKWPAITRSPGHEGCVSAIARNPAPDVFYPYVKRVFMTLRKDLRAPMKLGVGCSLSLDQYSDRFGPI